jgi:hypothetical protein
MKFRPAVAYGAVAAVAGYGVGLGADALGVPPLVASVPVVVTLVVFAWFRRTDELVDVLVPAFFIAYAGYAGIAIARVTHSVLYPAAMVAVSSANVYGRAHDLRPLSEEWLLVFAAGLPYALLLTIAVAFPVSMLPVRANAVAADDDALGKFIQTRNAKSE